MVNFPISTPWKVVIYRCALVFITLFWIAHMISLPVAVTYDGFIYIDMADVLGSSRFPQDWNFARTPLFPLTLKLAFWAFGRQPLAVIAVSSTLGLAGTFIVGRLVRRYAGEVAAALAMVVMALFPTSVAYQHFALTEVGTAFFLVLIAAALLLPADRPRQVWTKAGLVMAALIAGFYWRQALLQLSPFAAILYLAGSWRSRTLFPGHLVQEKLSRGAAILVVLALLIGVLPYLAAKPWGRYTNEPGMRDVMLRQAMIRQALLPPDDPYVTPNEQAYALALSQSIVDGRFYSGLREDLLGEISGPIFSKPMPTSVPSFFWTLVRRHPGRYAAGVGRTLLLFAGVKGLESENHISLTIILSPDLPDAKLGDGPPAIQRAIKDDFSQKTKPGAVLKLLWGLSSGYEALLLVASLVTFAGLIIGVIRREFWTVVLCGIPIMYMVLCALLLASIDRYAFPAYPLVIADCVLVPATWLRAYNSGEQKPANELAATLTDAT